MKLSEMANSSSQKQEDNKKKTINESYEELKDCSSDELMSRLTKEIQNQKAKGVFDYEGIISSIEKIKPYLPAQAYENMIRIIDNLK